MFDKIARRPDNKGATARGRQNKSPPFRLLAAPGAPEPTLRLASACPAKRVALFPLRSYLGESLPESFIAVVNGAGLHPSTKLSSLPKVQFSVLPELAPRLAPRVLCQVWERFAPPQGLISNPGTQVEGWRQFPPAVISLAAFHRFRHRFPNGIKITCTQAMSHHALRAPLDNLYREETRSSPDRSRARNDLLEPIIANCAERIKDWDNLIAMEDRSSQSAQRSDLDKYFMSTLNDLLREDFLHKDKLPPVVQSSLPIQFGSVDYVKRGAIADLRATTPCFETLTR